MKLYLYKWNVLFSHIFYVYRIFINIFKIIIIFYIFLNITIRPYITPLGTQTLSPLQKQTKSWQNITVPMCSGPPVDPMKGAASESEGHGSGAWRRKKKEIFERNVVWFAQLDGRGLAEQGVGMRPSNLRQRWSPLMTKEEIPMTTKVALRSTFSKEEVRLGRAPWWCIENTRAGKWDFSISKWDYWPWEFKGDKTHQLVARFHYLQNRLLSSLAIGKNLDRKYINRLVSREVLRSVVFIERIKYFFILKIKK